MKKVYMKKITQLTAQAGWDKDPSVLAEVQHYGRKLYREDPPGRPIRVTDENGIITIYPSINSCSRELDMSVQAIRARIAGRVTEKRKFERLPKSK